jgi:hypothetical protein
MYLPLLLSKTKWRLVRNIYAEDWVPFPVKVIIDRAGWYRSGLNSEQSVYEIASGDAIWYTVNRAVNMINLVIVKTQNVRKR